MQYRVVGSGMKPTFLDGDELQVDLSARTPDRGEIVVFHPPPPQGGDKKAFIKRVIGKPGDTVDVRDYQLFVNGREVVEPFISRSTYCLGLYCHVELGADEYYVLGDNRTNSSDSRIWGPVRAADVLGTVRTLNRSLPQY